MNLNSSIYLLLVYSLTITYTTTSGGDISRKMCKRYAEAVYTQEVNYSDDFETEYNNVSDCGIVAVPLIVGGQKAAPKEFPHFALIGYGKNLESKLKWHCGGTLISDKFVLTAAHCAESPSVGVALKVKLGVTDLSSGENDEYVKEEIIEKIITHPKYKKPIKYNDIGLLRLKNSIEFSPYIRPACLNFKSVIEESSAIVIGFGKIAYDEDDASNSLLKVTLDIISRAKCKTFFTKMPMMEDGFRSSMICAGDLEGGKDTCHGDSGGPMQVILEEPYCMYSIIGVTSFGLFCGFPNSPAVYTKVSHFVSWIEEEVWRD